MVTKSLTPPKCRKQKFARKAKRKPVAFAEWKQPGQAKPIRRYFGVYGTPESEEAYHRFVAEWAQNGGKPPLPPAAIAQFTVAAVVAKYVEWAKAKFRKPDGTMKTRFQDTLDSVKPLCQLYGNTPAAEFGPNKLKAVRQAMLDGKRLCRKTINERVGIIKRVFAKAVEFEMLTSAIADKLAYVEGLSAGDADVRESKAVLPVSMDAVDLVEKWVSRQVWALIQLQLLTGARPSELLGLKLSDLNTKGDVWRYAPAHHKTAHHGKHRLIVFGPRARAILEQFITDRPVHVPMFSPAEAERERRGKLHAKRKTPLSCGNRPGANVTDAPAIHPGDTYSEASYRRAIARACDKADEWAKGGRVVGNDERMVPRWHPYQLRHNFATNTERQYGMRATQTLMGHSPESLITLDYLEADTALMEEIALKAG